MSASTAFADLGYHVDDGDLGYAGASHGSFVPRQIPSVADIRPTPAGDAASAALVQLLRGRFPSAPRQQDHALSTGRYWSAINRIARGTPDTEANRDQRIPVEQVPRIRVNRTMVKVRSKSAETKWAHGKTGRVVALDGEIASVDVYTLGRRETIRVPLDELIAIAGYEG
ncbi:hypothetical protein [Burkholderia sp. ISTR5]|uniref:hypothetical protein n=1 Tax=Burkholderia sp. ISTR5 TaxID=2500161 RepID=UPI00136C225F|nr:hypothetical protein [Burkholderia sp. ISTR5]NBI45423.1 hypothetical protein [Burkholderia sp. ISTR5]